LQIFPATMYRKPNRRTIVFRSDIALSRIFSAPLGAGLFSYAKPSLVIWQIPLLRPIASSDAIHRLGAQRQNVSFEARLRACGSAVVPRNRFNVTWVRWWETTQQADIISSRSSSCSPSKRHRAEDNAMPRCHAIPFFKIEGFMTGLVASHATIGV
jgi:hypothetical protein